MSFLKTKVAVLRGGQGAGYEDSLKTGNYILSLLRQMPDAYEPVDIFVSRDGEWHRAGLVEDPYKAVSKSDVVWNTMHGPYGEDGKVQRMLEALQIPFVGSKAMPSVFSNNKALAKKLYLRHTLLTPSFEIIGEEDFSDEKLVPIFRKYLYPVIVKPINGVKALGVGLAHTFHELKEIVKKTFEHSPKALVEEYISGIVASCLVIESGKGEGLYSFIPVTLEQALRKGSLSVEESRQIGEMSKVAHAALGLRHYSSSDFIVSPRGKIYILETNSIPMLHEKSLVFQSLKDTGWRPQDFVDHCLRLALKS